MRYEYRAKDTLGAIIGGYIDADSEADARSKLNGKGLSVKSIGEVKELGRDDVYPKGGFFFRLMRALLPVGGDKDGPEEDDPTFDPAMMGMACLALVIIVGRQNMGISYTDMGIALGVIFVFCWWRAFITMERLRGEKR
jgi:hypothetical protein